MDHVHYFQIPQQPREGLWMEQVSKATRIPFNRKATQEPSLTTKPWKGKHVNCSMHKHGANQQKHSNHHSYTPTCAKLNTTERTTPCIAKAMQANGNIKWRLFDIARHENSRDKIISRTRIFRGKISETTNSQGQSLSGKKISWTIGNPYHNSSNINYRKRRISFGPIKIPISNKMNPPSTPSKSWMGKTKHATISNRGAKIQPKWSLRQSTIYIYRKEQNTRKKEG